ncbi:MAG: hypothetical protein ACREEM_52235, partial [Blastocatellia bacterium]
MAQQDIPQEPEAQAERPQPLPTPEIKADAEAPASTSSTDAEAKDESRRDDPKLSHGGASANLHSENFNAENAFVAGWQQFNQKVVYGAESLSLSARMAMRISAEREQEIAARHVADDGVTAGFLMQLREKRILVLSGEANIGKGTTALYLGHRLRREEQEKKVQLKETYLFQSLAPNVKLDLREVADNGKEFGNRLLFFNDAFARGNRDLLEFFTHLDHNVLQALSTLLQQQGMFLILTADTPTITGFQAQLGQLRLEATLPSLSHELLWQGLCIRLAQLPSSVSQGKSHIQIEGILASHKEDLLKAGRTMPRIVQFVDVYLPELLKGKDELGEAIRGEAIRDAFRRLDNLTDWFHNYLAEDFESWCFTLTLGLAHSLPYFSGVSWFEFERLRESIVRRLADGLRWMEPASGQTPEARPR